MTKILIILSVVIAILLGLLGVTYSQMRKQRSEAIRWEHNYEQASEKVSRIELTYREFKDQATEREDSLLKQLDIKPKQVEKIVYIENTYTNTDTTPIPFIITGEESIIIDKPIKLKFVANIDCLSVSGNVYSKDVNSTMEISSIAYKNDFNYVAYWKRREWRLLGINTRIFGKKQGELKVTSTCGETIVKEIDIIKKK